MKQLVINGDDAGICRETNRALEIAFRRGVLTSVSVMPNMPAFEDAIAMSRRNPALGTGVHLVLTSGRPVSAPVRIPLLVTKDGMFRHGFAGLWRQLLGRDRAVVLDQVRRELTAQIERAAAAGLRIDHLDSHRHIHMLPAIWPIVVTLARQAGCEFVRVAAEHRAMGRRWSINGAKAALLRRCASANAAAGPVYQRPSSFAGVLDSGRMTVGPLTRVLRRLPEGVSEISTHPSDWSGEAGAPSTLNCAREDRSFLQSRDRRAELDALVHGEVRHSIKVLQIQLTTFGQLCLPGVAEAAGSATC